MLMRVGKRGDTIVEVLLAVAVVSAVLGGAYVATSRSLRGVRNSQERSEALKLVEGQVERLKEASRSSSDVYTTSTNPFCLNDSLNPVNTASAACNQGPSNRYALSVQRTVDSGGFTFVTTATWTQVTGDASQVSIRYRAYQQ